MEKSIVESKPDGNNVIDADSGNVKATYGLYRKTPTGMEYLGCIQSCKECIQPDNEHVHIGIYRNSGYKILACDDKECPNYNPIDLYTRENMGIWGM